MGDSQDANHKKGYMTKQGGRIKTWKKRWFVLDRKNKVLKYYRRPEDDLPKGVIHIEGYQVGEPDEVMKKPYAFMISKDGFRTYYMFCEDQSSKNSWMEELRELSKPSPRGGATPISSNDHYTQYDDDSEPSDDEEPTLRRPNQIVLAGFDEQTIFDPKKMEPTFVNRPPNSTPMYDPNVTRYDPNATLIGYGGPQGMAFSDPNATLMAEFQDPNQTLVGGFGDPNATLIGMPGDENATLVGDATGGFALVNNSAKLRAQASATPQVVPHLKMIPYNPFFSMVERNVLRTLKFGRKSEDNSDPDFIAFDSKVVSRRHAEIWVVNGDFYIRDTKSQSGTFLNAMRLSLPGEESKPFKLKNGDTIQFGVDLRGSNEANTKCVSVTIELSFTRMSAEPPAQAAYKSPIPNMSDLTLMANH